MARLDDQQRRADSDDLDRLAEDRLGAAGILAFTRQLERALGGLDVVEPDDAPLGLRHCLLRDDEHVSVLERHAVGDERGEVVALADLGETRDGKDPQMPVSRIPACAL